MFSLVTDFISVERLFHFAILNCWESVVEIVEFLLKDYYGIHMRGMNKT